MLTVALRLTRVREDAEDRRHDELGDVEEGGQDPDHARLDANPANSLKMGEVIGKQCAGEPGAQAKREGSEQDRGQRAARMIGGARCVAGLGGGWIHARKAYRPARAVRCVRARPAAR